MIFIFDFRQQRLREKKRLLRVDSLKRKMRRRAEKPKVTLYPTSLSQSSHCEINDKTDTYKTPEKFLKQIRQRTYDCNQNLPESKELKCAVVSRVVGKLMKSPSTSGTMSQIIKRHSTFTSLDSNDSDLVHSVLKIQKYKTSKNIVKAVECVTLLKQKYSIRNAARKLKMQYSHLHRLLSISRKPHGRSLSNSCKANIVKSYTSNKISMQLPFKRYSKFYYLRTSLAVAYDTYAREQLKLGFKVLSQSSVYRSIKGQFRTRRRIPFKDTQCTDCVNNSLLVDALIVSKIKGIKRRITENILNSLCPIDKTTKNNESRNGACRKLEWQQNRETISDHNRDCIFRLCKKCGGITKLQESIIKENPDVDWNQLVTWHQWKNLSIGETDKSSDNKQEKPKRILDKVRYRGTLAELLSLFVKSVNHMSIHLFHFRWQAFQFDECKKQLQDGDVLLIMDFATNYSHHKQDEVHGAFWCRKQTTLHPIIAYYPCPCKCGHLVRDEIMIISNDLKHDSFAVNTFVEKALKHLRDNKVTIKRLIMWSDNCGPQYKSCKVFDAVSKYEYIPIMRNYFCAKHGKAEADGAIGRMSMHIDSVVRSGTHEFSNAGEIFRYCLLKLTIHNNDLGKCCHWQRHYFEVSQINRDEDTVSRTVKGTLTLHSVRNVGVRGIIEVRESSCFCEVCFLNAQGECKNRKLVEDFAWASLYKNLYIEENFENKLWDAYSLPYTHAKKPIFRPMTGSVTKRKGTKMFSKSNRNEKTKESIQLRNVDVTIRQRDSDDSDYEDDLPLIHVKEGLKDSSQGESPIGRRTRKRMHEKNIVLCEKQGEMLYLEDYERVPGEVNENSLSIDIEALSPAFTKKPQKSKFTRKEISNEQVLIKRNVNEGIKTSTPQKPKGYKECYIDLSPISKSVLSKLNHDCDFDN